MRRSCRYVDKDYPNRKKPRQSNGRIYHIQEKIYRIGIKLSE